ncbi:Uncharacterized protein TCM_013859 [Theobroma cacao]|uniref:Uncharacterized protein n=1 Tax=Theobroma cacao TaxID=3641 RepID=A0A061FXI3_THECC|nr:Uncharacterized protein TCM_013859 [Theobroma cacao]
MNSARLESSTSMDFESTPFMESEQSHFLYLMDQIMPIRALECLFILEILIMKVECGYRRILYSHRT